MSGDDKRGKLNRLLDRYANFVVRHRFIIIAFVILFTIFTGYQASNMKTTSSSQEDFLPEGIEVIEVFDLVTDQFAGSESSATIVVETAPKYANSTEIRDVRDPEVLRYVGTLEKKAELVYGVISAESAASVIKQANDGRIPSSKKSVKSLLRDDMVQRQIGNYINDDYSITVVRIDLMGDIESEELTENLRGVIKGDTPPGLEVKITGSPIINTVMSNLAQETMGKTSLISFALIFLILIIIFTSIKYGLIPLLTIVFGVIWSYGMLTLAGFEINPQTSSVMAMIMGIGIDFGIQVSKRFRYELASHEKERAMVNTLNNVFFPMLITTLAAIIGFRSLSLSQLPMMADMGNMMAVGVAFCMLSAVTVVPVVLLLFERGKTSKSAYS